MKSPACPFSTAACISPKRARSLRSGAAGAHATSPNSNASAATRIFFSVTAIETFAFSIRNGMLPKGAATGRRPTVRRNEARRPWGGSRTMSQERPWFKSYPQGVPHEVDLEQYRSIVSVFDEAISKYRDRPAFRNFGKTLTYGEIDKLSRQFAAYLLGELKLKKGDRVAIMMPNCLQYPIAIFGVLRAGLTVVNTNPMYTGRELRHQLKDSGASAIVVLEMFAHTLAEVIEDTPIRQVITTCIGDLLAFPKGQIVNFVLRHVKNAIPDYDLPGAITFKQALARGEDSTLPALDIRHDDIAFLQYTGGTTGVAKGAMLTHRNLVANMQQSSAWISKDCVPGKEIIITALPLYHIFALTSNCLVFMKFGGLNVLITEDRK